MGGIGPCTQWLASAWDITDGLLTFRTLQKLECETAALRRKCAVVVAPLAKSNSLFLVLCGVWEGNAGNQDVWFGEEAAGGADRLLLQPGPLVPVFPELWRQSQKQSQHVRGSGLL